MKKFVFGLITFCLSISISYAGETVPAEVISDSTLTTVVKVKEGEKPELYIDGKKYDVHIMDLIDPDKIESISVFKGQRALELYQCESVIVVKTKPKSDWEGPADSLGKSNNESVRIRSTANGPDQGRPVIVIDGKTEDEEALQKLNPDDIKSIEVKKDEKTLNKYNSTTGVILVTTKKKH